nr:hypothetical protein [Helicobacter cetorum]
MEQNIFSLLVKKKSCRLKKLEEFSKLKRLKVLLPLSLQENLKVVAIKDDKLLFAFESIWACKEFNKEHSKRVGRFLKENVQMLELRTDLEIIGYVPKDSLEKADFNAPIKNLNQFYCPSALGNFHNSIQDETLHALFEKARSLIGYQRRLFEN